MGRSQRTVYNKGALRVVILTFTLLLLLAMFMSSSGVAYSSQIKLLGILPTGVMSTSPWDIPRYDVYIEGVILSDDLADSCKRDPFRNSTERFTTESIESVCLKIGIGDVYFSGRHNIYVLVSSDGRWAADTVLTASVNNRSVWIGGSLNSSILQGEIIEIYVALEKEG